ncbi:hypothetical protein BN961_00182 [Afipia felis]|uniref:Uncharacterized protein n=1 Tax=Afipia felis TaxID=1035 RepID=A0A090MKG5_AFIFE|nr:hypothetical protein BN961_00182 [Afipia felis]
MNVGDFVVDVGGLHRLRRLFGDEITDLLQKRGVSGEVDRLAAMGAMPFVDLLLQFVALFQKRLIVCCEFLHERGDAVPEFLGGNSAAGYGFLLDEFREDRSNLQAGDFCASHFSPIPKQPLAAISKNGMKCPPK